MRGIGAQLGQICRIDVLFGARGRSHYGLQSCLSTEWELWNARWGMRWWLVPAKKVKQAVLRDGCRPVQGALKQRRPWDPVRRYVVCRLSWAVQCSAVQCGAANTALSSRFGGCWAAVLVYAGSAGARGRGGSQRVEGRRGRSMGA
jgi:hypothetical protein